MSMTFGPASAEDLAYFITSPDMRWAYQVNEMSTGVVIKISSPGYEVVTSEQGVRLEVAGASAWTKVGEPRLPVFPAVFQLAAKAVYHVEVIPGEFREEAVTNLLPLSSFQSRSMDDSTSQMVETMVPDAAIYQADAFWPESFYTVDEAKGRGQRYLRIGIQPFKYNPVSGKLRFHPDLEIKVYVTEPGDSRSDE